jgi:hypothetical protein
MRTLPIVVAVAALAVGASASEIPNAKFNQFVSTFSTNNIPHWTVGTDEAFSAQSGVYFVVDGINALSGAMVLLTTAPNGGGSNGSTDVTTLSSEPFVVDNFRIEFQYVYVTGESAAGAAAGYTDPFSVSIVRTSDSAVLFNSTVATAADTLLASTVNLAGILPGSSNRQTTKLWTRYGINSIGFIGDEVRIVFRIEDAGDDQVNSGVFLENVEQLPEPGALVLFGLGAAGLGAQVWRRRRRARAA